MKTERFYAVKKGYQPGVYVSSDILEQQVNGYEGAYFREFETKEEAYDFLFGPFGYKKNKLSVVQEMQLTKKYSTWPSTFVSYTDGSQCEERSSYGFIIVENNAICYEEADCLENDQNGSASGEFCAVVKTIEYALQKGVKRLFVFYDYAQVREVLEHPDKVQSPVVEQYKKQVYDALRSLEIQFIKVGAHKGNVYNEYVDSLVKRICRRVG